MWALGRMEQFSFQIKSRTSTWNRLRALKLCAFYPQSCMEFLTILGTTALMASSFTLLWTDTITSPPKFGPIQLLILPKFCLPLFNFLRIEIWELTATKHLWTYVHLNARNKFSVMNRLVKLLYSLRQVFLTFFCAMDPFESLVKPTDPFLQKCI